MNTIQNRLDIEFTSIYGHLTFTLTCTHCLEKFEKHSKYHPIEIVCPYCKTLYRSEKNSLRREGRSSHLTYQRTA